MRVLFRVLKRVVVSLWWWALKIFICFCKRHGFRAKIKRSQQIFETITHSLSSFWQCIAFAGSQNLSWILACSVMWVRIQCIFWSPDCMQFVPNGVLSAFCTVFHPAMISTVFWRPLNEKHDLFAGMVVLPPEHCSIFQWLRKTKGWSASMLHSSINLEQLLWFYYFCLTFCDNFHTCMQMHTTLLTWKIRGFCKNDSISKSVSIGWFLTERLDSLILVLVSIYLIVCNLHFSVITLGCECLCSGVNRSCWAQSVSFAAASWLFSASHFSSAVCRSVLTSIMPTKSRMVVLMFVSENRLLKISFYFILHECNWFVVAFLAFFDLTKDIKTGKGENKISAPFYMCLI